MSGLSVPPWLVSAMLLCGLGLILFRWLRSCRCDPATSGLLSALVLAQPAFWDFRISASATLLSAAAGGVSFATLSFLKDQDVRRIALLGGSLAGAQLVNPLWGTMTTIMVPLALRRTLDDRKAGGLTGLYVSILFIPALTAVGFVILDEQFRSEVWALAHFHSAQVGMRTIVASLLPAVPLVAALAVRPWDAPASIIAAVAVALLVASVVLDLVAIESNPVSAAFAVLSLMLVAGSSARPPVRPWALLLLATTSLASWGSVWLVRTNA